VAPGSLEKQQQGSAERRTESDESALNLLSLSHRVKNSVVAVNDGIGFFIEPTKKNANVCEIATNALFLHDRPSAEVKLADGKTYKAEAAKRDVLHDLEILRISGVRDAGKVCQTLPVRNDAHQPATGEKLLEVGVVAEMHFCIRVWIATTWCYRSPAQSTRLQGD
jgi:hypothetical protein